MVKRQAITSFYDIFSHTGPSREPAANFRKGATSAVPTSLRNAGNLVVVRSRWTRGRADLLRTQGQSLLHLFAGVKIEGRSFQGQVNLVHHRACEEEEEGKPRQPHQKKEGSQFPKLSSVRSGSCPS